MTTADGCPDCGRDLDKLGGNPECETCAAEPAADGTLPAAVLELGWCNLHGRAGCTLCDECGHEGAHHLNAHGVEDPVLRALVFRRSTCWAENVCGDCEPVLHVQLVRELELTRGVNA